MTLILDEFKDPKRAQKHTKRNEQYFTQSYPGSTSKTHLPHNKFHCMY